VLKLNLTDHIPELGQTIGEELIEPTKIYSVTIQRLIKDLPIHGIAHITGGGIPDNIVRVIPKACEVEILGGSWETPPIFTYLKKAGKIAESEMQRTFNNGIGMIAVVPETAAQDVMQRLDGMDEKAYIIGQVVERKDSKSQVKWIEEAVQEC